MGHIEDTMLAIRSMESTIISPLVRFKPTCLVVEEGLEYDDWERLGQTLMAISRSHAWWIGDWWVFGEHAYGERAAQAIDPDGRSHFKSFANAGWVARKFETSRRREVLTWSHHAEVAAMAPDEADRWLGLAESEGWSEKELRTEVHKARHLEAEREALAQAVLIGSGVASVIEQDALDFLRGLRDENADLLLTDPPYMTDVPDIAGFAALWLPLALSKVKRTGRAYICTGPYPQEIYAYLAVLLGEERFKLANILIWTYRNTLGPAPSHAYKNNWQAIFYLHGHDAPPLNCPLMNEQFSVQDIAAPDGRIGNRYHAWQKPEELAERIIRHSTEKGATVIDPFAGTGTFVKVAAGLGRFGLGAEHDKEALTICVQRGIAVTFADTGDDRS